MTEEGLNYYLEWHCSICGANGSVICEGHKEGRRFLEAEGWTQQALIWDKGRFRTETRCPDCKRLVRGRE